MADVNPAVEEWQPPASDQEWKVTGSITEAPVWVDKNWASWAQGPAIAVPMSGLFSEGPYTTQVARPGDTIFYKAPTPSREAHFEVIQGEPDEPDLMTKKPPQQSAASLEDMIKTGVLQVDELSEEAKGQVLSRSPKMKRIIEDGVAIPEPVAISDIVKVA